MQLRRIPPRILIALGLSTACGPQDKEVGDSGTEATGPCLDVATTACLGALPTTGDPVGPCLDIATSGCLSRCLDSTTGGSFIDPSDSSFGPCLDVAQTDSSDSGTDSGSDSGTDSGSTTGFNPCLAPEPPDDSPAPPDDEAADLADSSPRGAVLDRVLSSGRLPPDIMARLRKR
jgi:hypothetical protein